MDLGTAFTKRKLEAASVVGHDTPEALKIVETLVMILSELPVNEFLRARRVSRLFYHAIENSPLLRNLRNKPYIEANFEMRREFTLDYLSLKWKLTVHFTLHHDLPICADYRDSCLSDPLNVVWAVKNSPFEVMFPEELLPPAPPSPPSANDSLSNCLMLYPGIPFERGWLFKMGIPNPATHTVPGARLPPILLRHYDAAEEGCALGVVSDSTVTYTVGTDQQRPGSPERLKMPIVGNEKGWRIP